MPASGDGCSTKGRSSRFFRVFLRLTPTTMSLVTGSRLGPYEIVSPIGEGGMGDTDPDGSRTLTILSIPRSFASSFHAQIGRAHV